MTRIVFADVETTHLDPQIGHIWELALIVRDPGEDDVEYVWQIRPDLTQADPGALRVGGYYDRLVPALREEGREGVALPFRKDGKAGCPTPVAVVASDVARMLDGAALVGQNAQFDAAHVAGFLRRNGQAYTAHYRPVCVTTLAAGFLHGIKAEADAAADAINTPRLDGLHPDAAVLPWSSRDIANAVGVTPGDFDIHTALGDARLARHLWDCVFQGGAS